MNYKESNTIISECDWLRPIWEGDANFKGYEVEGIFGEEHR